jgi:hypothetical protein
VRGILRQSVHGRIDDFLDSLSADELRSARAWRIFQDAVQTALEKSLPNREHVLSSDADTSRNLRIRHTVSRCKDYFRTYRRSLRRCWATHQIVQDFANMLSDMQWLSRNGASDARSTSKRSQGRS